MITITRAARELADLFKCPSVPVSQMIWREGDGSETTFELPLGWEIKNVFVNGLLMRPGDVEDYVVEFDGFVYSIVFNVAPAAVSIGFESIRRTT